MVALSWNAIGDQDSTLSSEGRVNRDEEKASWILSSVDEDAENDETNERRPAPFQE